MTDGLVRIEKGGASKKYSAFLIHPLQATCIFLYRNLRETYFLK